MEIKNTKDGKLSQKRENKKSTVQGCIKKTCQLNV